MHVKRKRSFKYVRNENRLICVLLPLAIFVILCAAKCKYPEGSSWHDTFKVFTPFFVFFATVLTFSELVYGWHSRKVAARQAKSDDMPVKNDPISS